MQITLGCVYSAQLRGREKGWIKRNFSYGKIFKCCVYVTQTMCVIIHRVRKLNGKFKYKKNPRTKQTQKLWKINIKGEKLLRNILFYLCQHLRLMRKFSIFLFNFEIFPLFGNFSFSFFFARLCLNCVSLVPHFNNLIIIYSTFVSFFSFKLNANKIYFWLTLELRLCRVKVRWVEVKRCAFESKFDSFNFSVLEKIFLMLRCP